VAAIDETASVASLIVRYPRESVGILLATCAVLAVYANALFMQKGPHPAPIFAARPLVSAPSATAQPRPPTPVVKPVPVVTAVAPPNVTAPKAAPMNRVQLIVEIQRALTKRGFYDGTADGIWGGKTGAGMRDFVRAAGLSIIPEASEETLRALSASPVTARIAAPAARPRNDPIAALINPSQRVLAIQRALTEFGYGQITPTGTYDTETRTAIEKFERDRSLTVTGDISDRFVRELASMTGRPLE
jgi:peptidoglycan hydrolase-like protein with peptidoglycan-binding domain